MIKIVSNKNKKPSLLRNTDIKNWIINAETLMGKKDYINAEKELRKILKKTNNIEHMYYNTIINNHLGIIYAKNKQYTKALYRFSLILEFNPENKLARKNLNLIAKKITNDESLFDKSLIDAVKSDYAQAKQYYVENNFDNLELIAFRLINDYETNSQTSPWISYSHCFMGVVMSNQKKYKDSIHHYIQAIKLNSNNSHAEKMIFDTIDDYINEKVNNNNSENDTGYLLIENNDILKEKEEIIEKQNKELENKTEALQTKENELNKKNQEIDSLKNELNKAKSTINNLENQINMDSVENDTTDSQNDTPSVEDVSDKAQNDEVAELKKKLMELEKQNKEQKSKIDELTKKNTKLKNQNAKHKNNAEKWKNHSLLYEKEFNRLTSQLESFVKMYQDMNLREKREKLEETA